MASDTKRTRKDGSVYYEIKVSRGRGQPYATKRWTPPDGWSQRAIDKELSRVKVEFEQEVRAGKVLSKEEKAARKAQEAAEAAKILTLRQCVSPGQND